MNVAWRRLHDRRSIVLHEVLQVENYEKMHSEIFVNIANPSIKMDLTKMAKYCTISYSDSSNMHDQGISTHELSEDNFLILAITPSRPCSSPAHSIFLQLQPRQNLF
jgi:hypothetical protein